MLDKVNVLDTLKVSNNVDTLKVLDVIGTLKVSSKIGTLKVSSKLGTLKVSSKMNTLKVLNKLGTIEVSQQGYLLEKCNVLARGMVKEEWCGPMGWEVRYHLMGLQDKVGRLEDWEVRYQFKGLTSCKRLDTIEESAVMDPQGLKLMCKRLDTIEESAVMDPQGLKEMCKRLDATEESVMVMDLNDVKFKVIEQYQVVCEINLKDEVIGKMMDHPWKEFQWECNSMR
jgi:tetrahydromethanopterin S-methyltransferase subunit G